jgi:phosphoenolpyruvate carboxylase
MIVSSTEYFAKRGKSNLSKAGSSPNSCARGKSSLFGSIKSTYPAKKIHPSKIQITVEVACSMTLARNGLLKAIQHIESIKTSVENQDYS